MATLIVFNQISVDGYFADAKSDMSWAHRQSDPEWDDFTKKNARGESVLLFGRITYQLMESFWPTPQARQQLPEVADAMNDSPKVVFSTTLAEAKWKNTTLVKADIAGAVRRLKRESPKDLVLMGSGSIITQLTNEALIDEYHLVVQPIVLGAGKSLFAGVKGPLSLKRTDVRQFKNGNTVVHYLPAS